MTNPEPHTTGQRVSSSWLADLRAAEEAATPGPAAWTIHHHLGFTAVTLDGWDREVARFVDTQEARFYVSMRNALPQLLAAAETIERVAEICDRNATNCGPTSTLGADPGRSPDTRLV